MSHPVLIKLGGSAFDDATLRAKAVASIAQLPARGIVPVVVHGGGKEISRWLTRLGMETRFVDGLRVTDAPSMEITEMVLSGRVNRELVSLLNLHGARAVGLSGRDGAIFSATAIRSSKGEELGLVGEVSQVRVQLIELLIQAGFLPVIAPVGVSSSGVALNINADYVAAAVGGALQVRQLIYLTDVPGVLRHSAVVPHLTAGEVEEMIASGEISGGMIPKVRCCLAALQAGAHTVRIVKDLSSELLAGISQEGSSVGGDIGTVIVQ